MFVCQLKLPQERLEIFFTSFLYGFLLFVFFHLKLSSIWMSVLNNDFDISAFSLSGIITKPFQSSMLGCLIVLVSGFSYSSNLSLSIRNIFHFWNSLFRNIWNIFMECCFKYWFCFNLFKNSTIKLLLYLRGQIKNIVGCVFENFVISI